jgi:hypothetical protein
VGDLPKMKTLRAASLSPLTVSTIVSNRWSAFMKIVPHRAV